MMNRIGLVVSPHRVTLVDARLLFAPQAQAQQTLRWHYRYGYGQDRQCSADTVVHDLSDQTKLTRTQKSNAHGATIFVNLPHRVLTANFYTRRL